jgi:tripartite ATP-independent transporter DctP family solute receptor
LPIFAVIGCKEKTKNERRKNMRRQLKFMPVVMLVLFLMVGLSVSPVPAEGKVVMKWAHINNPGMAAYDAPRLFAKKIEELSRGEMTCRDFPSGQLGGERDMVESLKLGTIQISHPNIALLALNYPKIGLYQMPFLFKDFNHAVRVADSPVGQELARDFEKATGLKIVGYFTEASRGLYNNAGSIYKPEQMKNRKIRVMENELFKDMFAAMDALPTPLPYPEVYSALATNLVEFADSPIDSYKAQKFYEVAQYYSLSDHVTGFKAVVVSAKFFNGLSKAQQEIFTTAMNEATKLQQEKSVQQQQEVKDWLSDHDVKINFVNKAAFKKIMEPVHVKWKKKLGEAFANKFFETAKELQ